MARQLARRQHRERLAGVFIAVLGVAVLIVAIIALRNPKQPSAGAGSDTVTTTRTAGSSPSTSGTKSTSSTSAKSSRAKGVGSKPLIVLNDTGTANLARNAASRFTRGGWHVSRYTENYNNDIVSTCAYYDPTVNGAKKAAVALQKQYPTIKRVVARFAGLPAGPVVVVLTTDYAPS